MNKSILTAVITVFMIAVISMAIIIPASAAGNVSDAIEKTWNTTREEIQSVVDKVVFPVIDTILTILFFVKISMSYMEYKKHGQFDFTGPAILLACLVFSLTAPLYIWTII